MAKAKSLDKTKIHRISATDSSKSTNETKKGKSKATDKTVNKKVVSKKATKKAVKKPATDINQPTNNPFKALANYFKGAWVELKQVRWPSRAATWQLTLAVILFTAIFAILILLLDAGFNQLFEQILR